MHPPFPIRLDLSSRVFELTTAEIAAKSDHLRIASATAELQLLTWVTLHTAWTEGFSGMDLSGNALPNTASSLGSVCISPASHSRLTVFIFCG